MFRANVIRLVRGLSNLNQAFKVGDKASIMKLITQKDVDDFSRISGDTNPVHLDGGEQRAVVHGALLNGLVSGVIGTQLPGPGTLVVSQNLNFPNKCYVDETVCVNVEILEYRKIITVRFVCEVEALQKIVLYGDAKLILSKQK